MTFVAENKMYDKRSILAMNYRNIHKIVNLITI